MKLHWSTGKAKHEHAIDALEDGADDLRLYVEEEVFARVPVPSFNGLRVTAPGRFYLKELEIVRRFFEHVSLGPSWTRDLKVLETAGFSGGPLGLLGLTEAARSDALVWADGVQLGRASVPPDALLGLVKKPPPDAVQRIEALRALAKRYDSTRRKQSAIEAPTRFTRAYVLYSFACGHAALGDFEYALNLSQIAEQLLPKDDALHNCLIAHFEMRLLQTIWGRPIWAPLPVVVYERLDVLDRVARYKADRLLADLRLSPDSKMFHQTRLVFLGRSRGLDVPGCQGLLRR